MKPIFIVLLLLGLAWSGCGQKETPAPQTTPKAPPVAAPTMPALTGTPATPPPPGTAPAAAAVVAAVPTYEGKDEAEKLTAALHDYYTRNGATAPMVTSFETLVKARVLKSVPVPPAGKKYIIDTTKVEVRLENK